MRYPTMNLAKAAGIEQLCRWTRFLSSPGKSAVGQDNAEEVRIKEAEILDVIMERQKELGGWTPTISKAIGWEESP